MECVYHQDMGSEPRLHMGLCVHLNFVYLWYIGLGLLKNTFWQTVNVVGLDIWGKFLRFGDCGFLASFCLYSSD